MSDDDFDLPFEDEAEFLAVTEAAENGKRTRADDDEQSVNKKAKTGSDPPTSPSTIVANRVLKERFGLDRFRLKQEAAITRLLDGQSTVIVFPTGAGKSLCYQVPAVAFRIQDELAGKRDNSGITVVISPLIALMKDQVDALRRRSIKAAILNSAVSRDEYLATQNELRLGRLDLLYCAPERLNSEGFISSLKAIPGGIRLLAVDEAHCISEWGHSFRPDYLKIARFAKEAQVERVACLTATATAKVAQDICDAFDIPPEGLFSTTVYRPNLRLLARSSPKGTDDLGNLVKHLKQHQGPTIIYVTIQKATEDIAEKLRKHGFPAKPYHAGLSTDIKTRTQDEFLASKNMIVVATIAFGMGIDKSDIRNIIHYDIPSSIESYSQQIGRAGRDGLPSTCLFNLSTKDFHLRNIFTYGDRPSKRSLRLLLEDICSPARKNLKEGDTFVVSLYHQSRDVDISPITLSIIYAQLELQYKLFRAAGALYTEYKYVIKLPQIVSSDASPAACAINRASVKNSKWTHVALDDLANTSGIPRADLVRKVDEWNERGAIQLEKKGVQNMFRLLRPLPTARKELEDMINQLDKSMGAREMQDLQRTKALINLVTDKKCFSLSLAKYFGESSDTMSEECGHCTWCETHEQVVLPNEPPQPPDPIKVQRILEKVTARDDPRFLAKIAFGINSPRITAEKIKSTGVFESMNVCDFLELLKVFTAECGQS